VCDITAGLGVSFDDEKSCNVIRYVRNPNTTVVRFFRIGAITKLY